MKGIGNRQYVAWSLGGVLILLLMLATIPASAQRGEYQVVINHEEQYSVWPVDRELKLGWKETGIKGTAKKCSDYIEEVWTDMRPLSLRRMMDYAGVHANGVQYRVVINHEEQYSVWPANLFKDNSTRWRNAGKTGSLEECHAYIEEVWTDMRPLSLRE